MGEAVFRRAAIVLWHLLCSALHYHRHDDLSAPGRASESAVGGRQAVGGR